MATPEEELREYLSGAGNVPPTVLGSFRLRDFVCKPAGSFLQLHNIVFTGDVVFDNVNFQVPLHLSHAEFRGKALFRNCLFTAANFTAARFREEVDFTRSTFGIAYFWRVLFAGPVMMQDIEVKPDPQKSRIGSVFNGETNFSYAQFTQDAVFTRARLMGRSYFIGTRFKRKVQFDGATFGGPPLFEIKPRHQITITKGDFSDVAMGTWPGMNSARLSPEEREQILAPPPHRLFHRLLAKGVISQSGEHGKDELPVPAVEYADFPPPDVRDEVLEERLKKFAPAERKVFAIVCDTLTEPIFSRDEDSTFEGAEFSDKEADAPHFVNVDLSRCLFKGTKLGGLFLDNVTWGQRRMLFWMRATLRDEAYAENRQDFGKLREAYLALKGRYEAKKDFGRADAFQRSEMEMERLGGSYLRLFHKFLNVYNTSLLLPIAWLLLSLTIFPLLYWAIGSVSSFWQGLIYTLSLAKLTQFTETAEASGAAVTLQFVEIILFAVLVLCITLTFKRRMHL